MWSLFATVPIPRINACTQSGLMVYFLPADKKGRINYSHNSYTCYIMNLFLHWLVTRNLYIPEWLKCHWHCSEWDCPCLSPKQTYSHLLQPHDQGSFCLACLDLAIDPKSQTQAHINHTDTHHKLRQHSNTVAIYSDTYFPSFHILMGKWKRACWTWITLLGTITFLMIKEPERFSQDKNVRAHFRKVHRIDHFCTWMV